MSSTRTGWILAAALAATAPATQAQKAELPQPRAVTPRGPLLASEQAQISLFENVAPSVAYITTEHLQRTSLFTAAVAQGAGSGFIWDNQGHVVTNHHVVAGARRVTVQLDAGKPINAKVIGVAPEYDLAVVKLAEVPRDLRPIPLGTSRDLRIGQSVYAVGNPFGLSRTLTQGLVSALDRHLPTSQSREIAGAIQTDAAINPGNSGGPLLDSSGRLIGVTTAIRGSSAQSSGVGLAIPVDLVNRVVPFLIARGKAPQPAIGISAVDPAVAARVGLSGVVILDVRARTPAAEAGLKGVDRQKGEPGDIIVAVNGRPVDSIGLFAAELDRAGIGGIAELTVQRDGQERKVRVKVFDGAS